MKNKKWLNKFMCLISETRKRIMKKLLIKNMKFKMEVMNKKNIVMKLTK